MKLKLYVFIVLNLKCVILAENVRVGRLARAESVSEMQPIK